jgi:hypothetical protein
MDCVSRLSLTDNRGGIVRLMHGLSKPVILRREGICQRLVEMRGPALLVPSTALNSLSTEQAKKLEMVGYCWNRSIRK